MDKVKECPSMTVDELATALGISKKNAYALTRIEGFPVLTVGRRKIINRRSFETWFAKAAESGTEIEANQLRF